jgi:hypothetical protein
LRAVRVNGRSDRNQNDDITGVDVAIDLGSQHIFRQLVRSPIG